MNQHCPAPTTHLAPALVPIVPSLMLVLVRMLTPTPVSTPEAHALLAWESYPPSPPTPTLYQAETRSWLAGMLRRAIDR